MARRGDYRARGRLLRMMLAAALLLVRLCTVMVIKISAIRSYNAGRGCPTTNHLLRAV